MECSMENPMVRWLIGFAFLLPRSCVDPQTQDAIISEPSSVLPMEDGPPLCSTPPWRPTTHLPGTLLRDHEGRFWVADRWPDRRELVPSILLQSHYEVEEAIPLSAEEERCLRPTTAIWYPQPRGLLKRLPNETYWYIDERAHTRRLARPSVIMSWRDRASDADRLEMDFASFEERYRDLGPMPPPDGAIFQTGGTFYLFSESQIFPFVNEALFREVGYDLARTIDVTADVIPTLGRVGPVLTISTFSVCPLAAAQLRRTEDHDVDGVPFFEDCDDDDARRAPGREEICDGIDNDCDLVIDDGFRVGYRCTMDDTCHTQTYTRCAEDHVGVVCRDDEARCGL